MDEREHINRPDTDPLAELIRGAGRRPKPPAEHYDAVRHAARSAWQAKVRSRTRIRRIYALAASILIASLVVPIAYQYLPSHPERVAFAQALRGEVLRMSPMGETSEVIGNVGAFIEAGDRLRTGAESGAAFSLGPSTSLRLNGDTEVVVSSDDSITLIAGAAYLDTGHRDNSTTLTVSTPFGTIRDIGTQFEVFTSALGMRVRVRTGSIEWTQNGRTPARTGSSEQLDVTSTGELRRTVFPKFHPEWDWVQRLARPPAGQDRSILGYLQWIADEMGRELTFDSTNTELRAELATWNRNLGGLTPAEALSLIDQGSDFDYSINTDGEILITRQLQ